MTALWLTNHSIMLDVYSTAKQAHIVSLGFRAIVDVDTNEVSGFSDAVTNATSPTDSYVYYLPLGVSLPGTTAPSCSECLRDTMSAFGSAATNRSQPVSNVFASAAAMIDLTCGADFVNASIPRQPTSAAASFASTGLGGLGSIALLVSLLTVLM